MSELDKIKRQIKVYLEDVDCSAIAMTSDLGACSLMNEPFLLKSRDNEISLTEEQIKILKEIGEYEVINKTKKDEKIMDEKVAKELQDENAVLKAKLEKFEKELKEEKIKKEISDFSFEEELNNEVSKALIELEDEVKGVVLKAFTFLKDMKVETDLQKQLKEEAGKDGETEVVEKDLITRIKEARENK